MEQAKFDFIRYANCWEDPENLLKSLNIKGGSGVSVLSAGDNTLALLTGDPAHITAIDVNPTQIHLFNLKKAGFQALGYDDLLRLLGVTESKNAYALFLTLENRMDREAFEYFRGHKEYFDKGIINIGKFERYFQIFRGKIIPLFSSKRRFEQFSEMDDIDEQARFYNKYINNHRFKAVFNAFFGFRTMGKLGRDKHFYDYVENKEASGRNIKKVADYALTHVPNRDNPYANYIFLNRYPQRALPLYLRRESYPVIRERLDRIEVRLGDLESLSGKYDFFNLSDIFEYMSDGEFVRNTSRLCKLSNDGARLAYYNMQNKRYFSDSRLSLQTELSEQLTKQNRAFFYRDFLVYEFGEQREQDNRRI